MQRTADVICAADVKELLEGSVEADVSALGILQVDRERNCSESCASIRLRSEISVLMAMYCSGTPLELTSGTMVALTQ